MLPRSYIQLYTIQYYRSFNLLIYRHVPLKKINCKFTFESDPSHVLSSRPPLTYVQARWLSIGKA